MRMVRVTWCLACLSAILPVSAVGQEAAEPPIIPWPARVQAAQGAFVLTPETEIVLEHGNEAEKNAATCLGEVLEKNTGTALAIREAPANGPAIVVDGGAAKRLGEEGYRLEVAPEGIRIRAKTEKGLFYGIQTLRQLLPLPSSPETGCQIPCVAIDDAPRFRWRGLMLDCTRTFWDKAFLLRYLDVLAMYKMNVLHLYLAGNEGWRIAIDGYPKLTEVGSKFAPRFNDDHGGFYSQEDIREVLAHAAARHITVIPEIAMPGDATAALAAYPEYACGHSAFEVSPFSTATTEHHGLLCAGNESMYRMLEGVLGEVTELFDSPFIHISGHTGSREPWTQCPLCQARMRAEMYVDISDEYQPDLLQGYFLRCIEGFVGGLNRRVIVWDENLGCGLSQDAVVMVWRGPEVARLACAQGHDVIFCPDTHCRLDHPGSVISLQKAYAFDPDPGELDKKAEAHLLGAEGRVWTHAARTEAEVDRRVFPRLLALAEVTWSPQASRDYAAFHGRLRNHATRLDAAGIAYDAPSVAPVYAIAQWNPQNVDPSFRSEVWDITAQTGPGQSYRVTFQHLGGTDPLLIESVELLEDGRCVARDQHLASAGLADEENIFSLTPQDYRESAKYTIRARIRAEGGNLSYGAVWVTVLPAEK